ncbi:hypothetical protein V8C26DRAFT_392773 [Trichoderma gracile]
MWLVLFAVSLPWVLRSRADFTLFATTPDAKGASAPEIGHVPPPREAFIHLLGICHDNEAPQESQYAPNVHMLTRLQSRDNALATMATGTHSVGELKPQRTL